MKDRLKKEQEGDGRKMDRPDYRIVLQADHIKRLEEENSKYKSFLEWMLKQQYYILPVKIKSRIKELLER